MRAAAGSERWRPEQTHPGRLVDHAVEVGRASGCALSAQTASRSSCAHVAMFRSPRCHERPGNVPGVLMDVARDLARWFFWTALRFERAYIAVELTRTIQKRLTLRVSATASVASMPLTAKLFAEPPSPGLDALRLCRDLRSPAVVRWRGRRRPGPRNNRSGRDPGARFLAAPRSVPHSCPFQSRVFLKAGRS